MVGRSTAVAPPSTVSTAPLTADACWPARTTRAPSATNRCATAAPIPVPAPVITATRPSSQPADLFPPPRSASPAPDAPRAHPRSAPALSLSGLATSVRLAGRLRREFPDPGMQLGDVAARLGLHQHAAQI